MLCSCACARDVPLPFAGCRPSRSRSSGATGRKSTLHIRLRKRGCPYISYVSLASRLFVQWLGLHGTLCDRSAVLTWGL